MLIAVVLNAISIFLVMGPSLLGRLQSIQESPFGSFSVAIVGHAALGSVTELLGVWIVGSWHLQSSTQGCAAKRKIMRFTLVLWITTILLGFLLYAYISGSHILGLNDSFSVQSASRTDVPHFWQSLFSKKRVERQKPNILLQICTISGIIPSLVNLSKPTVGLAKNGGAGVVGLPGFMNKTSFSHFMLELCVCP